MHIRARIVAGTALALVMTAYAGASAQAGAPPPLENFRTHAQPAREGVPQSHLLLAQAAEDEEVSEEERPREAEEAPAEEAAPEQPAAEQPAPEQPAEQAPAQEEVQEEPAPEAPAAEEPPAEEPAAEEPAPEPPAEEPVQQEAPEEPVPAPEEPAAEEPAPAPEEPAAEQPAEETAPSGATEEAPAGEETDRAAEPVPGEPAPPQDAAPTPPPQDAAPTPPADAPVPPQQDAQPPAGSGTEPVPGQPAPPQDAAPTPPTGDAPIPPEQGGQPPADSGVEPVTDEAPREAPILDSAKEDPAATGEQGEQEAPQEQPAEAAPPPASDQEAQRFEEPVEVQSLRAEEGRRIDRREERRERREGASVVREIGDRVVIQLNNQIIVQSDDRERIERDASEVYYEELRRGRTRETVVRPNGVQVVTVYDRYGDVIRRSRIMPDGREHVLVYAGDRDRDGPREWRDPGLDLPPLRLAIPAEEYILDAGRVREEETYYDFLAQPPVDQVRRPYSVDEVRYSARVRDSVRRIDLDTITFDFGSASISEDAIPRLAGVAEAMERLLERNPGEVFLIEGHTDAVGSDQANLALSDQRAESVATAMANVFGIPPENLVTQGYGERYLKIDTSEPEQENRRVAIRRITPLVAPIASAE